MPSSKGKPTDPKLREEVKEQIKNETNKDGGGKGQWSAWKAAKLSKEYEAKGGSYENEAGSKNEPKKGAPTPKSSAKKKEEEEEEEEEEERGPKVNGGDGNDDGEFNDKSEGKTSASPSPREKNARRLKANTNTKSKVVNADQEGEKGGKKGGAAVRKQGEAKTGGMRRSKRVADKEREG